MKHEEEARARDAMRRGAAAGGTSRREVMEVSRRRTFPARAREKEKNLKKQQGKNAGNTEGLTPAQRAERYASDSPLRDSPATP